MAARAQSAPAPAPAAAPPRSPPPAPPRNKELAALVARLTKEQQAVSRKERELAELHAKLAEEQRRLAENYRETGAREQRVFPPPTPVTQQMLPSHKAARSAEAGARQGYQSARDMMRDD